MRNHCVCTIVDGRGTAADWHDTSRADDVTTTGEVNGTDDGTSICSDGAVTRFTVVDVEATETAPSASVITTVKFSFTAVTAGPPVAPFTYVSSDCSADLGTTTRPVVLAIDATLSTLPIAATVVLTAVLTAPVGGAAAPDNGATDQANDTSLPVEPTVSSTMSSHNDDDAGADKWADGAKIPAPSVTGTLTCHADVCRLENATEGAANVMLSPGSKVDALPSCTTR